MEQSLYGKVWIAGAGPGDAGLLTLRTAELIEEADVIVYDALLSAEILSRIPRETETIYVGKTCGKTIRFHQEEINQILVREAKKGKRVLRHQKAEIHSCSEEGGEEIEILRNEKFLRNYSGNHFFSSSSGLCGDSGDSSRLYLILSCDYRTYEKRCKTRH